MQGSEGRRTALVQKGQLPTLGFVSSPLPHYSLRTSLSKPQIKTMMRVALQEHITSFSLGGLVGEARMRKLCYLDELASLEFELIFQDISG